jgi:hypothetical protein
MPKLKLSKTARLVLGISVFVFVLGILIIGYVRLAGEHASVAEDLSSAQSFLPQVATEREYWESQLAEVEHQLAQATSALNASKSTFPSSVDSVAYDEELFILAHAHDLEITYLTASESYQEDILGITYDTTIFEVQVQARYPLPEIWTQGQIDQVIINITSFLSDLTSDDFFNNAAIELVSIAAPGPNEEATKPAALITLIIYGYQEEHQQEQEEQE